MNITNKTKRTELIAEIANQRAVIESQTHRIIAIATDLHAAGEKLANAERTIGVRDTDIHNLLGALRVMADSSREVRIRKSTVRDSDLALAMPARNTD